MSDPKRVGRRVEVRTGGPIDLFVQARKIADVPVFTSAPQQSDYVVAWDQTAGGTGACGPAPVHRNTRRPALGTLDRLKRITKRIAPAFVTDLYRRARDRRAAKQFDSDLFRIIR